MCAAVVGEVRPLKMTSTVIWFVLVFHVTVVVPVPGEASGGFWLLPFRVAVKTNTESLQPAIEPTGTQLLGLLPVTCVLRSVTEPSGAPNGETFAIPPPATEAG